MELKISNSKFKYCKANPKITIHNVLNQIIPPLLKKNNLAFSRPTLTSIQPNTPESGIHPYIIEAAKAIYGKTPYELTDEEHEHYAGYRQWKIIQGEPIEEDSLYQPS